MNTPQWTAEFNDHHLAPDPYGFWVSVDQYSECCELSLWSPNCGFDPKKSIFTSLDEAKAAGEKWLREVGALS